MIVLDSAAAVDYLIASSVGEWVEEQLLGGGELHAPHLLDVEVSNALRARVRDGSITRSLAEQALEDLGELDLTRYPHLPFLWRAWELRASLTAYDGVFVALAEALGAILVTTDSRLARAPGIRATVVAP